MKSQSYYDEKYYDDEMSQELKKREMEKDIANQSFIDAMSRSPKDPMPEEFQTAEIPMVKGRGPASVQMKPIDVEGTFEKDIDLDAYEKALSRQKEKAYKEEMKEEKPSFNLDKSMTAFMDAQQKAHDANIKRASDIVDQQLIKNDEIAQKQDMERNKRLREFVFG